MGILDNAKYAELGKKAEAEAVANGAIQKAMPSIEKEAIRKFAPVIQKESESNVLGMLGINTNGRGLEGLAGYGLNLN